MAYDEHDRLTIAVAPGLWGNAAYAYDVQDNLIRHEQGTQRQWRYAYASKNRLIQINTVQGLKQHTFAYAGTAGARGNITAKNTQNYQFDSANRLTAVTGLQTYRYDGLGRRVQTTDADGKTTFWQYSRAGQVIYASEARKSRNTDYIYLGNTQVAQRHMAWGTGTITVEYQHTDALGSPVAQTNASGQVIERTDYNPWGEVYAGGAVDGPGYTGHVMDAATGLTYMQQRYYDPTIGRFLSVDPVTAYEDPIGAFNRYWYANNNPYKFTDPDGRRSFLVSRPLDFKLLGIDVGKAAGNHNFIVHHAERPGDSSDTVRVRSYGITSDGTMGEVDSNTEGRNANTSAQDRAAWESLADEGSNVTFREINASDEVVQGIADSVSSAFDYSYLPEKSGGFNSNTAAGAIAQEADGGSPSVDNGRRQPGTSQERISTAREQVLHKPVK